MVLTYHSPISTISDSQPPIFMSILPRSGLLGSASSPPSQATSNSMFNTNTTSW